MNREIRLTQFSPGAGCGCKIAPSVLEEILKNSHSTRVFENLIVGNESKDDAAVYDIGGGISVISTTDFFTPIVDNPYNFGRIAATNAISDIYAMGGRPIMAIAILAWPLEKLAPEIAGEVISGARSVCDNASIPLAGGHSISSADPIFGLAVTGIIETSKIKRNNLATEGSSLFLTKPIGIGIVTTAEKFGIAKLEDREMALKLMTSLNKIGVSLSEISSVKALTDVTGFGLLGHSLEIAEGSGVKVVIQYDKVPRISGVDYYIEQGSIPGGTNRNFASYGDKVSPISENQKALLCDPQTSGGLLIAVEPSGIKDVKAIADAADCPLYEIGHIEKISGDFFIEIV